MTTREIPKTRPTWDEYFMSIAKIASSRSTCNSRPTAAVIVRDKQIVSIGYNGAAKGADHCAWPANDIISNKCKRRRLLIGDSKKNSICVSAHSEANAIAFAAKNGVIVEDTIIYCTLFPCYTCLKLIINAGINEICYETEYTSQYKDRDDFVRNEAKLLGLKVRRIMIWPGSLETIKEVLLSKNTSARRLTATK